ncbi:carbohydrate ABC transporter substrate-binding protein (CUT1 family) [Lachnotalea glycerini]|uniref:Carbohydrate ABC transporter substrate-binding protein (CUT1 family) n=1 Tax=Lachnotalea glycerini TaxID=1763509 RepID=A0A255IBI6_9FIRM|nr:extracellular solute-binding protein [Lachnotalea glycerini]PXV89136.1 carbohydrate ABC transporter substrate-binding protein (CUT1 family) [Lachnotalea glycerini]RDY28864.1 extracellular solute-binding protein [Lachnotalea glycerini]
MRKKFLSVLLCTVLAVSTLAGCKNDAKSTSNTTKSDEESTNEAGSNNTETEGEKKYPEFITVDVFDGLANYQGIQSGWFAKIVKDKFNMELNMISPNVSGGGDTLYQTRSAAGDLGDLIIYGADDGKLQDMVTAGLLTDLSDLIADKEYLKQYQSGIDSLNDLVKEDGVYAIPASVSEQSAITPSEGLDPTFGPYLRWDAYKAIGYTPMSTLEDLLPVLKAMQEAVPTSDSGKQTYGISLFKDWDGNMMCLAKQPTCFYGFDELGFVLAKADGSEYQSIIDSDSMYTRVLKFYYDANQMGIVDPESTTQNYDTLYTKYQDGQILYSPWPWLGQSAYNTTENKAAGKGFMISSFDDMSIFSYGCKPNGDRQCIGIGSKAEDKERLADFIDWLYSPEGIEDSAAQTAKSCGPEGLTWEMKDNVASLTEFGWKAFYDGGETQVPDEWGGGTWKDGVSALNFQAVSPADIDPKTGCAYNYNLWDSVIEANTTLLDIDWQTQMNAKTTLEYLQNNDKLMVAPGSSYITPAEDSEITTLRGQCKAIIVEYSWKMVFASSEDEFNSLLSEMQDIVKGLGYDQVLAVDMQNAKDQNAARIEAAAEQ